MSTFKNPVGPQPSNVYWRRRLVVGLGLLAVIVIILLIVFAPRSTDPTPVPTGTGSSGSPAAQDQEDPNAQAQACVSGVVTVVATTDKGSYSAGQLPQLSLSITNSGSVACTFNAGSDVQQYLITSGSDSIWNSTHCQLEPVAANVELAAGETISAPAIQWDRTRSDPSTCEDSRSQVSAGGATYKLQIIVDGVESEVVPFLLNS
ncbi:MAG: hypothetical protein ACOH1J_08980 [Microbacteriaceae bacterium]